MAWLAVTELRPVQSHSRRWPNSWHAIFWLLVLMIGLRHEVGGDWFNYFTNFKNVADLSLQEAVSQKDPAYNFLEWLALQFGLGVYFVNAVCAVLFTWGLLVFCRAQPRPWLALLVAVPYLVTVVAMGYTRQATAIGLVMLGVVALSDRKTLRFVVFVALAATFHKSAVILLPLAVLASTKRRIWTMLWVGLSSVLFYWLLLENSVGDLKSGYLDAQMQSQGAAIRVAMNAVPAALFLWYRRRFVMSHAERTFWTWMSFGALGFVALLIISSSSTAVDRLALYWIPLQIYVLSRLPNAIGKSNVSNGILVKWIIFYSAAVLFVWLFFAQMSYAWLPYQFYPWVWLWQ